MAQQEIAQDSEQAAAAMAAASVAADIDTIIGAEAPAGTPGMMPDMGDGAAAQTPGATTYLVVKELRSISRARSLRLQAEDLIVAVDGQPFKATSKASSTSCSSATRTMASFSRSGATG